MKNLIKTSFAALAVSCGSGAWALSPPNISSDILWTDTGGTYHIPTNTFDASLSGVVDITSAFNNGRRQEEIQLGLPAGTLGKLDLPAQAEWDKMTDDAKGLWIINEERQDRANMLPGVIGLPLAGIESHMDNISKKYGDLLHDTDTFNHTEPYASSSPYLRIDQDADIGKSIGCHQFLSRGENLASFATNEGFVPLPLERGIYNFIYEDSASHWGHREAALLQDEDLDHVGNNPQYGFVNNHASPTSEGFLGVYVRSSPDYNPFGDPRFNYGSIVVMNIFDPVNVDTCHYNTKLKNTEIASAKGKVPTRLISNNEWVQIGLNTAVATGSTVADIIGDDISAPYDSDWVIFSYETDTDSYKKLSLTDTMIPGDGYWLIQATGSDLTIDMPSSSSGVYVTHTPACTSTEGCFEISLPSHTGRTQWQMIGYPFRDSRNMEGVRIVTNSGDCLKGCTLSEAGKKGLTSDKLWHFDGKSAYEELSNGGSDQFDPWDAAWFEIAPKANGLAPKMLIPATNVLSSPPLSL